MPPRHALRGGVVGQVEAEVLHGGEGEGGDRLDALAWSGLGLRVRVRVRARVRVRVRVRVGLANPNPNTNPNPNPNRVLALS